MQQANFQERRVIVRKHIIQFCKLQSEYMAGLRRVLGDPTVLDDTAAILAERMKLYVPSELSASDRAKSCVSGLPEIEERVREAAARDTLQELRCYL